MTPAVDAHRLRKLAQTASPVIRDYDLHPPDDLRLFPMPKAGVLRFNDDVFVAEVRYDEDEFEDAIARGLKRVELSEAGLLRPGVRASW